jgi:fructose-bisphosphate aldolase, class II
MHGSSSVPKDEVDRINAAGGQIKDSMGVDVNEYLPAAKLGVTKINIDTDGRLVWTRVHREFFRDAQARPELRRPQPELQHPENNLTDIFGWTTARIPTSTARAIR